MSYTPGEPNEQHHTPDVQKTSYLGDSQQNKDQATNQASLIYKHYHISDRDIEQTTDLDSYPSNNDPSQTPGQPYIYKHNK